MSNLTDFVFILDQMGIPYEKKEFEVTTAVMFISDDVKVFGYVGSFMMISFDNEDGKYRHAGIYPKAPTDEDPPKLAVSEEDTLAAEFKAETKKKRKRRPAPPRRS